MGRAIKWYSVRETHYRGVIRVSFFRFFRFSGAQSEQTRRLAEVGPLPRRADLTRLLRPFSFSTHRQAQTAAVSGPTFNFRLTSLSLLRDIHEPSRTEPRHGAPCRFDVRNKTTKRRVIAGARAPETSDFRGAEANLFRTSLRTSSFVRLFIQPIPPRSFHPGSGDGDAARPPELISRSRVCELCPMAN